MEIWRGADDRLHHVAQQWHCGRDLILDRPARPPAGLRAASCRTICVSRSSGSNAERGPASSRNSTDQKIQCRVRCGSWGLRREDAEHLPARGQKHKKKRLSADGPPSSLSSTIRPRRPDTSPTNWGHRSSRAYPSLCSTHRPAAPRHCAYGSPSRRAAQVRLAGP